ncbi:hypothetical protein MUO71_04820 [Candidatus Bathyarchaeota archaeon]|nr:hypothetical protein [Candidatus Bathyarchaeota archaeon]
MYNLDVRDEIRWMIEAKRKQLLRDMSQLEMVNLAVHPGEEARRKLKSLENEYYALEGIDKRREEWEASWQWLREKKRG